MPARTRKQSLLSPLWLAPLPVTLLIIAICMPPEASVFIGGLRLMMHRVVLLMFALPALYRLLTAKDLRFTAFDALFVAYNGWSMIVFMVHMGPIDGLQFGGSVALESIGAYAIARAYVRDLATYEAVLGVFLLTIGVLGLLALPEALLRTHYIHNWMAQLTGIKIVIYDEVRRGLMRAAATFEHPILYGAYCSSIAAMVWFSASRQGARIRNMMVITGATVLAMSSAPLNALVVQAGAGVLNKMTRGIPNRIKILGAAALVGYILISLLTDRSPFAFIAMNIALDPWTAYHRVLIWTYGMENIYANAIFGLGLGDWVRPGWMHSASVDAFWLLIPMRTGIPSIILLLAAVWVLVARVNRKRKNRPREVRKAALGWTLSFIALAFTGLTVHYWDAVHSYFFLLLGLAGWLADPLKKRVPKVVPQKAQAEPAVPFAPAYGQPRPLSA